MSKEYIKIPQNDFMFFYIFKNEWDSSVDILFEHRFDTSLINLFLLLKSYLINTNFLIKAVFLISKIVINENDALLSVYYQISLKKFKQMNYLEFVDWYEERYEEN